VHAPTRLVVVGGSGAGISAALRARELDAHSDVAGHRLAVRRPGGQTSLLPYDALAVGTGAVSARPPIAGLSGPDAVGGADGVHLLHSMTDTFEVMASLERRRWRPR